MNAPEASASLPSTSRPHSQTQWGRVLSFQVFLGALLVAATYVAVRGNLEAARATPSESTSQFFLEGDLWWHLTVGKQILEGHTWPTADVYSFTAAGAPWIPYEWLGDFVLAVIERAGGLGSLAGCFFVLQSAIILLIYGYAYLRCRNARAAFLAAALLLPLASQFAILRPQQFGYVLLLITLICLERFRQGHRRTLWFLPAILAVWVNTHGSFVLGCTALAVYAVSGLRQWRWGNLEAVPWSTAQRKQLGAVSLLSLIALVLTPYGGRLALYPFQLAISQPLNVAIIREWRPLEWSQWFGILLILLLLFFLTAQFLLKKVWRVEDFCLLVLAVYTTATHARFLMFFVPVFAPMLADVLARWMPSPKATNDRYILNGVLILGVGVGMVAFLPRSKELVEVLAQRVPVRAVAYLGTHEVGEPMFNDSDWGGYLIATRWPAHKVFIDGRLDVYEYTGVLADYLRIIHPGAQSLRLLARFSIRSCLIKQDSALAGLLARQPDWRRVYSDQLSVIYRRK